MMLKVTPAILLALGVIAQEAASMTGGREPLVSKSRNDCRLVTKRLCCPVHEVKFVLVVCNVITHRFCFIHFISLNKKSLICSLIYYAFDLSNICIIISPLHESAWKLNHWLVKLGS